MDEIEQMENLSLHISYLLNRHDCVIIPGIGALINIYLPSEINFENGQILPPRQEIRFNQALKTDDGLLANSYARKNNISFREGSEILEIAISSLENALNVEKEVTLGSLGILKKENEGNLSFHPLKTSLKNAEDCGFVQLYINGSNSLNSFVPSEGRDSISPLKNSDGKEDHKEKEYNTTFGIRNEKVKSEKKLDFNKNYYIPINKRLLRICACILIIVICGIVQSLTTSTSKGKMERASVFPLAEIVENPDTEVESDESLSNQIDEEIKEISSSPSEIEVAFTYHVIVATCTTKEEAEKYCRIYSDKGFSGEVIKNGKKYMVSIKCSTNKEDLIEEMNSAEFKRNISSAWIWKNNL